MSDPVISGFFKKYGGQRARPDGSMSDESLLRFIASYREMAATGNGPTGRLTGNAVMIVKQQLAKWLTEAKQRGLAVPA